MNERLKELAREAGLLVHNPEGVPTKLEKFAELIVRECMEVTVNYPHPQTKLTAAEHIARHFGVE